MNDEAFFYLLQAVNEDGKKVYAQWLKYSSRQIPPTLTHRAEYALRMLKEDEILECRKQIKEFGNWVSRYDFKIVKFLMKKEQLSWSPPIGYEFKEYKDYYEKQQN